MLSSRRLLLVVIIATLDPHRSVLSHWQMPQVRETFCLFLEHIQIPWGWWGGFASQSTTVSLQNALISVQEKSSKSVVQYTLHLKFCI